MRRTSSPFKWRHYAPDVLPAMLRSFHTAERTIEGVEAAHIMRKGQVKRPDGRGAVGQAKFVESLSGAAA